MTEAKSDDGTPYKIYWFKDDSLDFNPDNYEIGGLVKQVAFQSGELSGREFEVNWHENTKEFEIITQWPYDDGRQVPGDSLVPKPEDEYILWNIRMPDEYYPLAEQEYLEAVNAYMEENKKDVSVYKSHTDYIDIDRRKIALAIGQRVRLESSQFFGKKGYKETRITRITRSIDNPSDADIEMSDVLSKGTITDIQDGIEETKSYVDSVAGSLPGIVKSWEGTKLTDTNLMSSARTILEIARKAISKEYDDVASGVITFLKGLVSKIKIKALAGIEFGRFQSGKPGAGGAVSIDIAGNSNAEVDYLTVRKTAHFNRLMIQEAKHIGGRIIMSSASMLCSRIEETETVYRCYFEMADEKGRKIFNQFVVGDQAFRQTYNTSETVYYWRLVTAVGDDFIELSKNDCDKDSGIPSAGDEIVQLGNRTDTSRQAAQIMTAYGDSAPSYEVFNGINSFSLAGKNIAGVIYNEKTKEPFSYCFGDSYIGDRNIDSSDATFVTFQKREGDDKKKLHIQADVTLGAGSSGLENLAEWEEKQKEINSTKTEVDNLGYLKKIFPTSNLIANGAVIGQMVGVMDTSDTTSDAKVIAGLNGTDIGKDSTHGKVIMFGGSNGPTSEDIQSALTKIYEDGTIDTSRLIARKGAKFGAFDITVNNGKDSISHVNKAANRETYWSPDELFFGKANKTIITGKSLMITNNQDINASILTALSRVISSRQDSNVIMSLGANGVSATPDIINENLVGNFVFRCDSGLYAGLRPMARNINGTVTLSPLDYTIHCNGRSTIYMPRYPEHGQRYEILKDASYEMTLHGNGKNIWERGVSAAITNTFGTSFKSRAFIEFNVDNDMWILTFFSM